MRGALGGAAGGSALFLLRRHLVNTLCQPGSCPPPRGRDIIKGREAALQFNLMKSWLCHHFCLLCGPCWQNACSACQTRVPGLPGQKGEKGSAGEQGAQGIVGEKVPQMERTTRCSNVFLRNTTLNYFRYSHRVILGSEVQWETLERKAQR